MSEPVDVVALRGRSAILDCGVSGGGGAGVGDGETKPIIEWKKDGQFLSLKGDDRRQILANGSLLFKEVRYGRASLTIQLTL